METTKTILFVDRQKINYLRTTLESYDGMAMVRTLDPRRSLIEVMIAPGCETFVHDLLDSLSMQEGLRIGSVEISE